MAKAKMKNSKEANYNNYFFGFLILTFDYGLLKKLRQGFLRRMRTIPFFSSELDRRTS